MLATLGAGELGGFDETVELAAAAARRMHAVIEDKCNGEVITLVCYVKIYDFQPTQV